MSKLSLTNTYRLLITVLKIMANKQTVRKQNLKIMSELLNKIMKQKL